MMENRTKLTLTAETAEEADYIMEAVHVLAFGKILIGAERAGDEGYHYWDEGLKKVVFIVTDADIALDVLKKHLGDRFGSVAVASEPYVSVAVPVPILAENERLGGPVEVCCLLACFRCMCPLDV